MSLTFSRADGLALPDLIHPIIEITDPEETARVKAAFAASDLNSKWLAAHWAELMPACRGKYVAVAHQKAFLADTSEEALAWIDAQQPQDAGSILKYVRP